jgi:hypothetical protein
LRLVDELIRFAARREELFNRKVPRLTIRQEAQRKGDQFIVAEGSADWNTWWERLRTELLSSDKETTKFFDEQYEPIPLDMPKDDTRSLPEQIKESLKIIDPTSKERVEDPKANSLVWNPTPTPKFPFLFLRPILRSDTITTKNDPTLSIEELKKISRIANVQVLYIDETRIPKRTKNTGATEAVIIAIVGGVPGWLSQNGTYGIKLPLIAWPETLNLYRTV